MVSRRKTEEGRKVKVSISLSKESLDWLNGKVEDKSFGSISHGIEYAIEQFKKKS